MSEKLAAGTAPPPAHRDNQSEGRAWLSVHLPFDGDIYGPECDDVLRRFVAPFVARGRSTGEVTHAFFVRYAEKRSHVRLRLFGPGATPIAMRPMIERLWTAFVQGDRAGDHGPEWATYVPEWERYAGVEAILLAEELFDASSTFALSSVTDELSADRTVRLGRAMLATLTTIHTLVTTRERMETFVRGYSRGTLGMLQKDEDRQASLIAGFDQRLRAQDGRLEEFLRYALAQLDDGEELTPALDDYRRALIAYRREVEALLPTGRVIAREKPILVWDAAGQYLAASMVHMTNNRLGVSQIEEAYVAHALAPMFNAG